MTATERTFTDAERKEMAKKAMDVVVESHNTKQDVIICTTKDGKNFSVYYSSAPEVKIGDTLVVDRPPVVSPVYCPEGMVWNEALQKCVPSNPDKVDLKIANTEHAASYDTKTSVSNLFDGLIETRFSVKSPGAGIPTFIMLIDLGAEQSVSEIMLSTYKGGDLEEPRKYFLDVQLSNDRNVFNYNVPIETSGTTNEMETYSVGVEPVKCQYIRIMGKGNTSNDWNSYTGLKIRGQQLVDIQVKPPPKPDSGGELDNDKIKKFYKTDTTMPSWYMSETDPNQDPELDLDGDKGRDSKWVPKPHPTLGKIFSAKSREGGLASGGTQLTMRIHVTPLGSKGIQDSDKNEKGYHDMIKKRGYIISPQDFKNFEQTMILRLRGITKEKGRISHKQHGGIHTGNDDPRASCLGMIIQFKEDDDRLAELELFHPEYQFYKVKKQIAGINMKSLENQWLGTKCISLVKGDDVEETLLVNLNPFAPDGSINNNNWQIYSQFTFSKGVKSTDGEAITITPTWGGMVTTWRINEVKEVDVYSASIRSVIPE